MNLKYYIIYITTFLCLLPAFVFAQQVFTIRGVIYKKNTSERVFQVLITNLNNKTIMMSDELGTFKIKALTGDTLLFTKTDYTPQKQVVSSDRDIIIYMQPVIKLAEVKVIGQTKRQELNEVMDEYRSQGTFYNGKPPAWSFINSPITGLYELFGKTPGNARRFAAYSKGELEVNEVSRRYNKDVVKRVTKLPDSEVQAFMDSYKPSYEDVKSWNDYELVAHINRAFEYYKRNKGKVKLQKLY